ncbi:metallophosphoesterase family protein [Salinibaculum rarum]|uniref:metallophosphoesterase family protein n=1 Tax=Salinibaculum rarum TaxID=3058903 RepID=UPI00265E6311|nr:metallophosphoesterase family protein [Salinibaculum sp. KK48]
MKVALLSDIHANKHALDAVLDDLPDVNAVVCLGDIVGYGPQPAACLDTVREVADVVVQGNHSGNSAEAHPFTGGRKRVRYTTLPTPNGIADSPT